MQTLFVGLGLLAVIGLGLLVVVGRRNRSHDRPGGTGVLSRRWLMEHDRDEKL